MQNETILIDSALPLWKAQSFSSLILLLDKKFHPWLDKQYHPQCTVAPQKSAATLPKLTCSFLLGWCCQITPFFRAFLILMYQSCIANTSHVELMLLLAPWHPYSRLQAAREENDWAHTSGLPKLGQRVNNSMYRLWRDVMVLLCFSKRAMRPQRQRKW